MGDFDDFGELYADLEDRLITSVPAVEAEEGDNKELVERAGYENEAIECCSSSDSEDDLKIVLNEDYSNKPAFQLITTGRDCEEDVGDHLVVVTGADCTGIEPKVSELGQSVDGLLRGNRERRNATKGAHRNSLISYLPGSALRSWNSLSGRGHWDHLTMSYSSGNASYNLGFPMAFPNGCDYYLPRNRCIFDIDFESFECKPWRYNGVDITDYFNFGLDEEGWRTYCKQLVHFQQNKLPVLQSSKINKPTGTMSGELAQHGCDNGPEISDYLHNERKGIRMPRGRAIHVESGNGDRIPSVDVRRPRNRDFDAVIQITTGFTEEDALDPIRTNHVDGNVSRSKLLSNSSNKLSESSFSVVTCAHKCEGITNATESPHPFMEKPFDENLDNANFGRDSPSREKPLTKPDAAVADHYSSSSKSSDHNASLEAFRDEAFLEKVPSSECIHLNSDSWFQESVLSDCSLTNETGSDTSKIDCPTCGVDYSESSLDPNYSHLATPDKVVKLNLSADDGVASPLYGQKTYGKHQRDESDTVVTKCDDGPKERGHSSLGCKISLRNNIKGKKGKEFKATSILARLKGYDEDSSPVINKDKRYTAREEFKTRRNDCYVNRRAQNNSRIQNHIVNRGYLQLNSRNMFLYDRKTHHTTRMVDDHDMMEAHYNTTEAKSRRRERSCNESRERPSDEYREKPLNEYRERSSNECRERSLNEYRERSLDGYFGNLYEAEENSIDKCDRVHCSAGALRKFHEVYSYEKTQLADFNWSSRYADNCKDSRLYECGLHPRIYRDAYDADGRDCHDYDSHRNQAPSLCQPNKRYMIDCGYSHPWETFSRMSNKHLIVSNKKCHKISSRTRFNFHGDQSAEVRAAYPDNCAYNERRKESFPLPGLIAKEEVSFRHQNSNNSSAPKRYSLYNTAHHQNVRADKNSFSGQKVLGNHHRNSSINEFNVRSGKDSDCSVRVGCLLDDFVKDRHEQDDKGCREAISKHLNGWKVKSKGRCTSSGVRSQLDHELADVKESRESDDIEGCSHYKMKMTSTHLCPEMEIDELEEGQLVEESDNSETAEIKFNSDGRTPALKPKMDLTDQGQKNKLVGRYDKNHLLETLAKMEKRRERFKDLILLKKKPENYGDMQPDSAIKDEIKQQRPSRKRRWCGS